MMLKLLDVMLGFPTNLTNDRPLVHPGDVLFQLCDAPQLVETSYTKVPTYLRKGCDNQLKGGGGRRNFHAIITELCMYFHTITRENSG